jgi:hypothetical protein
MYKFSVYLEIIDLKVFRGKIRFRTGDLTTFERNGHSPFSLSRSRMIPTFQISEDLEIQMLNLSKEEGMPNPISNHA